MEHVRYRAVGDFNHVAIQAVLQGMLTEAYRYHCYHKMYSDTTVLMPAPWPTSASPDFRPMEPQQFIEAAHKRSLQVAIFKNSIRCCSPSFRKPQCLRWATASWTRWWVAEGH